MPSWKKVILSGSDAALNKLTVTNGITGSLLGTASFATSASRALTASHVTTLNQNVIITGSLSIASPLTFANPGVGNDTRFTFTKTNDAAWLSVVERAADRTYYEFGMSDNPEGSDFFQWKFNTWQAPAQGWMPLQMGAFTTRFVASSNLVWGAFSIPVNTSFATVNNNIVGSADYEIGKYTPTNSTTYTLNKDSGTGTGTAVLNAQSYTGGGRTGYWIVIDAGGTTFTWGNGSTGTTPVGTGIAITGTAQTLNNGVTVTLSLTNHLVNDRWSFLCFPKPSTGIGGPATSTAMQTLYPSANIIGQVIKGASGQTANLQEWQNSSGTVLAKVDALGVLTATNGITGSLFGTASNVQGGTANYIPLWNTANSLTSSNIYQSSSNIGIGGIPQTGFKLDVNGQTVLRGTTYTSGDIIEFGTNAYRLGTAGTATYLASASIGNVGIGTTTPNAKLDVNGNTIITGSFTVVTGSAREFQVTPTGVNIGNVVTDVHTITGSLSQGLTGNITSGQGSHAEGSSTISSGQASHAEGSTTIAAGVGSHAEGFTTRTVGSYSHAEGAFTSASGLYSHVEGAYSRTSGDFSHAEGYLTLSSGSFSHAEGYQTVSSGSYSHAEGKNTSARGESSHTEGENTISSGTGSHAEGLGTQAIGNYQHVQGQYNIASSAQSAFILGNGTSSGNRSNLIFASGSQVEITGSLNITQGITGSLLGTSSFSSTASFAPSYLPLIGGTLINGVNINSSPTLFNSVVAIKGSILAPTNILMISTNNFTASSAGSVIRIGHTSTSGSVTGIIDNLIGGATSYGNLTLQQGGGNVGIGTTVPNAKLDVNGNTIITGSLNVSGSITSAKSTIKSDAVTNGTFRVESAGGSTWFTVGEQPGQVSFNAQGGITTVGGSDLGARFNITGVSDAKPILGIRSVTSGVSDIVQVSSPTTTNGDYFIIKSTGNVGIGTTTPNAKLDVNGNTIITGSLRGFVSASIIASNTASIDLSKSNFFTILLVSGSNTHISASNIQPGQTANIRVTQASAGTGTVSFSSAIKQQSGNTYLATPTGNAVDILSLLSFDSTSVYVTNVNNLI